jgi:HSP20 family protein
MLVRWKPAGDLMTIQNEIDRVFDSFLRSGTRAPEAGWYPAIDLRETTHEFVLTAEVPGVKKDDIKLALTENVLTIRGEKRAENETKGDQWHQVERSYGRFERSFHLAAPVNAAGIKAKFAEGILTVSVPKSEEARPREIQID